jgi:hypothetical protein
MAPIFGCTHVKALYNQGATNLQDGFAAIKNFGFGSARLFLTPNYVAEYVGQTWGGVPTNLTDLASTAPFASVLGDADIKRYWLTTYTFANGINNSIMASALPSELLAEYNEVKAFAMHLLATYSGKTFILDYIEGDFVLLNGYAADGADAAIAEAYRAERFVAFNEIRLRAVRDATKAVSSTSRVLYSLECNRVLDGGVRMIRDVLPRLRPDIVAYTAYESINGWAGGANGQGQIGTDVTKAQLDQRLRYMHKMVREIYGNEMPVGISEYDFPENDQNFTYHTLDATQLTNQVLDTCTDLGMSDVIFWAMFDTEYLNSAYRGFWIKTDTGATSLQGLAYAGRLANPFLLETVPLSESIASQAAYNVGLTETVTLAESIAVTASGDNFVSTLLDGVNDYVSLGDNLSIDLSANEMAVSLFFRVTDLTAQRYLFARARPFAPAVNYILAVNTDGTLFAYFGGVGGFSTAGGSISVDTWHHALITVVDVAGVKTGRIYLDGSQVGGDVVAGSTVDATSVAKIGAAGTSANAQNPFKGEIDEVSIFLGAGSGFSAAEATEIYNGGTPKAPTLHSKASKLAHWLRMGDGDVFPTITDHVGSLNGTCTNMVDAATNFSSLVPP